MMFNRLNVNELRSHFTKSITGQITGSFITLIAIIILLIAYFIDVFATQSLDTADELYLNDEVVLVQKLLDNSQGDITKTYGEIKDVPEALKDASYRYYVRVADLQNKTIIETGRAESILHNAPFPKLKEDWKKNISTWIENGRYYFLITAPLQISKYKKGIIYVVLDKTYQHSLLHELYWQLAWVSLLAIIVVSLITYLISRTKMKPLNKLSAAVTSIELNTLQNAFEYDAWPNELKPIAKSFNEMLQNIECGFVKFKRSIAEMAHELKSPISNLISENSVTLTKMREISDYQDTIGSNLEELNRLNNIVNDILFIAQSDASKTVLNIEIFSANEIIQSIIDAFAALAADKNIAFVLSGDALLNMDRNLFKRVIYNLISNAIAYSFKNSKVSIEIKSDEQYAEIIIQDFGIGIAEADIENVFEQFYRTDKARTVNPYGNGLGLAIVDSILKMHDAKIKIISTLNHGTQVFLTRLPRK